MKTNENKTIVDIINSFGWGIHGCGYHFAIACNVMSTKKRVVMRDRDGDIEYIYELKDGKVVARDRDGNIEYIYELKDEKVVERDIYGNILYTFESEDGKVFERDSKGNLVRTFESEDGKVFERDSKGNLVRTFEFKGRKFIERDSKGNLVRTFEFKGRKFIERDSDGNVACTWESEGEKEDLNGDLVYAFASEDRSVGILRDYVSEGILRILLNQYEDGQEDSKPKTIKVKIKGVDVEGSLEDISLILKRL